MFARLLSSPSFKRISILLVIGMVAVSALVTATPASAHCDSMNGPVAQAALKALDSNNVKLVLPYVKPEAESELTAVFKHVMQVRQQGGSAKELADRYFIESAIRLHRVGEGAAYTGVTSEAVPAPILAADKAMQSGSMDPLYKMFDRAIRKSVQDKYQVVVKAREEAAKLGTVEAYREQAEAELIFEKFIYELYGTATAADPHAEGAAATGHAH
ncbi:MAG: DUF6448 family protein [Bacteroidota bacterium]